MLHFFFIFCFYLASRWHFTQLVMATFSGWRTERFYAVAGARWCLFGASGAWRCLFRSSGGSSLRQMVFAVFLPVHRRNNNSFNQMLFFFCLHLLTLSMTNAPPKATFVKGLTSLSSLVYLGKYVDARMFERRSETALWASSTSQQGSWSCARENTNCVAVVTLYGWLRC